MSITCEAETTVARPVYFRLPKQGQPAQPARNGKPARPARPLECDPYFGFSRSFYYQGEKRGYWKLVHIRDDGKERGVTLVPFHQVEAFVREQMEKQAERTHENEQSRSRTTFVGD
jgi:hypothetical protein